MNHLNVSRRAMLSRIGTGFGMLGLSSLLADEKLLAADAPSNPLAPKAPHFAANAKRVILSRPESW